MNNLTSIDYSQHSFIVNGHEGYSLNEALRLWKTKYETDFRDFEREIITHPALHDFRDFVRECWNDIKPVTVEEAFKCANTEDRRNYFDAIGVEKLFKELKPELKDKQVIKKKRTRWDSDNKEYEHVFEDVYELYEVPGEKLFGSNQWGRSGDPVYAVRCWCTTTNREYWLYVPREAATGSRWSTTNPEYDAIRAIAWTIRIDISFPERIYRQGDIIVVKESENSKPLSTPEHLGKQEYLSLMYSET